MSGCFKSKAPPLSRPKALCTRRWTNMIGILGLWRREYNCGPWRHNLPTFCGAMFLNRWQRALATACKWLSDCHFHSSLFKTTYLLQRPQGVHHGRDLILLVQMQEFLHHGPQEATFLVLEKYVEEGESRDDLVLLIQFDRVDLLYLPPLQQDHTHNDASWTPPKLESFICDIFFPKCSLNSIRDFFSFLMGMTCRMSDSQILQSWRNSLFPRWPCLTRLKKQKERDRLNAEQTGGRATGLS